jgi:lysophospholipase L1-like esterase
MLYFLFFLGGLLAYCAYTYNALVKKLMKPAPNYPDLGKVVPQKKVIVCAGDSITHGNMSHDWVSELAAQHPENQFFNAGINADLSFTLLRRLDDIIKLQPQHINLLIGTNDVCFALGRQAHYFKLKKINRSDAPTLQTYGQNLTKIVERLKNETTATISIMSLPVITEDLSHAANQMADQYSEAIKQVAKKEGIVYLPLREKQKEFLENAGKTGKTRFEDTDKLLRLAGLRHHILGTDWDTITRQNGNLLTFDNLHLNSTGVGMIRELIPVA